MNYKRLMMLSGDIKKNSWILKGVIINTKVPIFIQLIRNSFHGSVRVYTEGSCYQFYKILKHSFSQVEPYYSNGHVVSKIDGNFYDITGEVQGEFVPFDKTFVVDLKTDIEMDNIKNNKFGVTGHMQCPNCDEVFECKD